MHAGGGAGLVNLETYSGSLPPTHLPLRRFLNLPTLHHQCSLTSVRARIPARKPVRGMPRSHRITHLSIDGGTYRCLITSLGSPCSGTPSSSLSSSPLGCTCWLKHCLAVFPTHSERFYYHRKLGTLGDQLEQAPRCLNRPNICPSDAQQP